MTTRSRVGPGTPAEIDRRVARLQDRAARETDSRTRALIAHAVHSWREARDPAPLRVLCALRHPPVSLDTFLEDPDYLGGRVAVWPALRADLRALNPDVFTGAAPVTEALLGGAAGIGKSTLAILTTLYQLYLFTCFRDPRALYGLMLQTPIVFPLQSVNAGSTERILYQPLRELFEAMTFARHHLAWNRRRTSRLELAGGLHVGPACGEMTALLGQAIPGAVLDEVNFLAVVERSTRVAGPRGLGGPFDQAAELHRELLQRRRSRFSGGPVQLGVLIFSSSVHHAEDFLERRIREVLALPSRETFVSRHSRYDVRPQDRACRDRFRFQVGDLNVPARILGPDEPPDTPAARVELVPDHYRGDFQRDPDGQQRAVIGVATPRIAPFIGDPACLARAFTRGEALALINAADPAEVVLERDGWPAWRLEAFAPGEALRFVHIDLSLTRDRCGVAIVRAGDGTDGADLWQGPDGERRPVFVVEAAVSLQPSPQAELQLAGLRAWLMQLPRQGIPLTCVTLDGYQSADFRQYFIRAGIRSHVLSLDRSPEPYEGLRQALLDGRVAICPAPRLAEELTYLERNAAANRIDHPPRGSKDLADALCGALWQATRSRALRRRSGYPPDPAGRRRPDPPRPAGCRRR